MNNPEKLTTQLARRIKTKQKQNSVLDTIMHRRIVILVHFSGMTRCIHDVIFIIIWHYVATCINHPTWLLIIVLQYKCIKRTV